MANSQRDLVTTLVQAWRPVQCLPFSHASTETEQSVPLLNGGASIPPCWKE
jgi:hypothetical protein